LGLVSVSYERRCTTPSSVFAPSVVPYDLGLFLGELVSEYSIGWMRRSAPSHSTEDLWNANFSMIEQLLKANSGLKIKSRNLGPYTLSLRKTMMQAPVEAIAAMIEVRVHDSLPCNHDRLKPLGADSRGGITPCWIPFRKWPYREVHVCIGQNRFVGWARSTRRRPELVTRTSGGGIEYVRSSIHPCELLCPCIVLE